MPTEDEWYKAAYYKPDGSNYSTYANGEESIPAAGNGWNYYSGSYNSRSPWDVGTGAMEQNGTFDIMGNVWEWNESLKIPGSRNVRGGANHTTVIMLSSSGRHWFALGSPSHEYKHVGFRVASVPEPATLLLLGLGGLVLRRKL